MPLLGDVGDYLSTAGVATVGTDLFLGTMRDQPDAQLCVYEVPGMPPIRAFGASGRGVVAERPEIQVVSRAGLDDYATARAAAQAAYLALDQLWERTINGTRYLYVVARQPPFDMGRDEAGRVRIACNYDVIRDKSTST